MDTNAFVSHQIHLKRAHSTALLETGSVILPLVRKMQPQTAVQLFGPTILERLVRRNESGRTQVSARLRDKLEAAGSSFQRTVWQAAGRGMRPDWTGSSASAGRCWLSKATPPHAPPPASGAGDWATVESSASLTPAVAVAVAVAVAAAAKAKTKEMIGSWLDSLSSKEHILIASNDLQPKQKEDRNTAAGSLTSAGIDQKETLR